MSERDKPASVFVRPFLRAVANGFSEDGKRLKVTLIATPEPTDAACKFGCTFEDWPSNMARLMRNGLALTSKPEPGKVQLAIQQAMPADGQAVAPEQDSDGQPKRGLVMAKVVGVKALSEKAYKRSVNPLWRKAIERDDAKDPWRWLCDDIRKSLIGQKFSARPRDKYGDLGEATGLKKFHEGGAIRAKRPKVDDEAYKIEGIVPVKQGLLALDEEATRAQRILRKMSYGPFCFNDDGELVKGKKGNSEKGKKTESEKEKQEEARRFLTFGFDPNLGALDEAAHKAREEELKEDSAESRRKRHFELFKNAIENTDPARIETSKTFETIEKKLRGKACYTEVDLKTPIYGGIPAEPVASANSVLTGEGRPKKRASHTYGSWLQRPPAEQEEEEIDAGNKSRVQQRPYIAQEANGLSKKEAAAFELIKGAYYSLQGDPILSRLFCFAIDLEVELSEVSIPADGAVYAFISAEGGIEKRTTPIVWTAAKIDVSNSQFWPVSRFEFHCPAVQGDEKKLAKKISDYPVIDQCNGVWNMGVGFDRADPGKRANPRYDIISLDVRRSIEATTDVAVTEARDRGERQLTAGFTLIDTGRGQQIARDLAISKVQRDSIDTQRQENGQREPANSLVLYSEELTIGRRLDVAVAHVGTQPCDLKWRSLMNRLVDFEHMGGAERVLRKLLRRQYSRGTFRDEAAFQVAARHMPHVLKGDLVEERREDNADASDNQASNAENGEKGNVVEAVAEEAITLWDGTPMAILTSPGRGDRRNGAKPVLPFTRSYNLPAGKTSGKDTRPPPLRFGASYVLGMRSVFLGGGGPTVAQSQKVHEATKGYLAVPPASNKGARARRFLRHEGIDAPRLLLPVHLATRRHPHMGYEEADHAIIRTLVKPVAADSGEIVCRDDKLVNDETSGPPYIDVKNRIGPSRTMRVFIPSVAALDTVVRHRMLDHGDGASVIRGGLRDVGYVHDNIGFPIAASERVPSFNGDEVVYRRTVKRRLNRNSKLRQQNGEIIFEPQGTNTAKPNQLGYLADPAGEEIVVRLRVPGTDRYLEGCWSTKAYRNGYMSYPNVLPLVVNIVPRKEARSCPAEKVSDVLTGDADAICRLQRSGRLTQDAKGSGTRVRRVDVELAPGEAFELECVCLPSAETLAKCFSLPETIAIQRAYAAKHEKSSEELKKLCGSKEEEKCKARYKSDKPEGFVGVGGFAVPSHDLVNEVACDLLETIKNDWPIEELANVTSLRVAHGINAPEAKPVWGTAGPIGFRRPDLKKIEASEAKKTIDLARAISNAPDETLNTGVLIDGAVKVDLEQVDALEVVATTAKGAASTFDDPTRSRSLMARRSGRWPKLISPGGDQRYVAPRDVVGFDVAADGRVTLPVEQVTLLRADNLPHTLGLTKKDAGTRPREEPVVTKVNGSEQCKDDNGKVPIVEEVPWLLHGRLTAIDLKQLHAAAVANHAITMPLANDAEACEVKGARPRLHKIICSQPNIISDTKARRVILQAVALSRHADVFETAPRYVEGKEQTLRRRQALKSEQQSHASLPCEVWINSTKRPSKCDVRQPAPTFLIERTATPVNGENGAQRGTDYGLSRRAVTRLYFGRGWFSSGEGERVGIVLWPPDYKEQDSANLKENKVRDHSRLMTLANFDDRDLGPAGSFITRWGGDPIREDRVQTSVFIPPGNINDLCDGLGRGPHQPEYVARAKMPVPVSESTQDAGDEDNAPNIAPTSTNGGAANRGVTDDGKSDAAADYLPTMDVSLLTYEPCFDLDREEWYIDVDISPERAVEPFVRFGLVRYQEHSICKDIRVSEPVTAWSQILPGRDATLTCCECDDGDLEVRLSVVGQASTGIKPFNLPGARAAAGASSRQKDELKTAWSKLQRPKMKYTLVHEATATDGRLTRTLLDPRQVNDNCDCVGEKEGQIVWSKHLKVSKERREQLGPGRLFAYIEEVEVRMPATYPNGHARRNHDQALEADHDPISEPVSLEDVFEATTFQESGPRFSARIPFYDDRHVIEPNG